MEDTVKVNKLKTNCHYIISSKKLGFSELPCFIRDHHEHTFNVVVLENDEGTIELTEIKVEEKEVENSIFFQEIPRIVLETLKDKEKYFIKQNLLLAKNLANLTNFLG